jgi:nitroimidazol reductase NimA-like FMN-containing flavoprotein (pyridoxamine 5'-phosphate oxidase superfamily)
VSEIEDTYMLIKDMTREASIDLLARTRLCRLACAHEGQPYITPIHCVYDDNYLYGFSTLGQKITWMRNNPLVCVLAEELISPQDWTSVIVLGKYEELPDIGPYAIHRQHAYDLLQRRAMWWEPGYAETVLRGKARPMQFLYFRIHIEQISGHRGVPDSIADPEHSVAQQKRRGWIRKVFGRPEQ